MGLSRNLISEFVKITNDNKKVNNQSTVFGTIVERPNGFFVRLDGSDLLTPYDTSAEVRNGDRVTVMLKDHNATVTGNITAPATNNIIVDEKLNELTITADKINLHGYITANGGFSIDKKGNMTAVDGSFSGNISGATTMSIGESSDGSLAAFSVASNGVVSAGDLSQDGVTPSFRIATTGGVRIGGISAHTHDDGLTKGVAEITGQGTIYSCSTLEPETYVQITEGVIKVSRTIYGDDGAVTGVSFLGLTDRLRISDTDGNYVSMVQIDSDNLARFGYGAWESQSETVYNEGVQYLGGDKVSLRSKNQLYLTCNGAALNNGNGGSLVYFKNTSNAYVVRSMTNGDTVYLGTASYPFKGLYATTVNQTSDRNTKENIEYLNDYKIANTRASQNSDISIQQCYDFVKNDCMLATYNHIGDTRKKINFIANDLLVNEDGTDNAIGQLVVSLPKIDDEENSVLTFDTTNYISVVVGALQKAIDKIETLEQIINKEV